MANDQENLDSQIYIPVILAVVLISVVALLVWATQVRPVREQAAVEASIVGLEPTEEVAQAAAPVDMDKVIAAVNKGGCIACHTIPGIPNANGRVGPNLSNIGIDAATRREGYTAEEYIRESIADPLAFTAPECPTGPCIAGAMPPLQLDEAEIEALVGYLATLGSG